MIVASYRQRYLSLLGASSTRALEDRIVGELVAALRDEGSWDVLPIRLSRVAKRFLIAPRPQIVAGNHDGEMEFDNNTSRFVIKLCSEDQRMALRELAEQPRLRFTYAHEVAHRFFYVLRDGCWMRARDLVTADLSRAEQMKQRITLGRLEEGLCNSIARRVLVPEESMSRLCNLDEWFAAGDGFFGRLSRTAKVFGVSRDCLLVRLHTSLPKERTSPNCAMVIERCVGPVTQRGRRMLRVMTGVVPASLGGIEMRWYPGLEVARFGKLADDFVADRLASGRPVSGALHLPLFVSGQQSVDFRGWWRLLAREGEAERKRIMIWGRFEGGHGFT